MVSIILDLLTDIDIKLCIYICIYITVSNTYACIYICVYIYCIHTTLYNQHYDVWLCPQKSDIFPNISSRIFSPIYYHCNAKNVFLELGIEVVPVVPVVPHDLF